MFIYTMPKFNHPTTVTAVTVMIERSPVNDRLTVDPGANKKGSLRLTPPVEASQRFQNPLQRPPHQSQHPFQFQLGIQIQSRELFLSELSITSPETFGGQQKLVLAGTVDPKLDVSRNLPGYMNWYTGDINIVYRNDCCI